MGKTKSQSSLQSGNTFSTNSLLLDDDENDYNTNDNDEALICESQDIPNIQQSHNPKNIIWKLFDRMNPKTCFQPCSDTILTASSSCHLPGISEPRPLHDIVPTLLQDLHSPNYRRSNALHQLYRLTDRNHKYNRVPIVCNTHYNVVSVIVDQCLLIDENVGICPDRRKALLLLNNLCIPVENKAAILYGEVCESLLSSIIRIIHHRLPEAYISVITLLNLSSLNDVAKQTILSYVPSIRPDIVDAILNTSNHTSDGTRNNTNTVSVREAPATYTYQKPMDHEWSMVRIVEKCCQDYTPYIVKSYDRYNSSSVPSVEMEFLRWSMNLFRTLVSTVASHAICICNKTIMVQLAGHCLYTSVSKQFESSSMSSSWYENTSSNSGMDDTYHKCIDMTSWTENSLEDASLMILVHCAKHDDCIASIQNNIPNLRFTLQSIIPQNHDTDANNNDNNRAYGIHEVRAKALYQRLFIDSH